MSQDSIGVVTTGHETYRNGRQLRSKTSPQIERHSYSEVGWISRQNLLALRSRENFFLDIPFYRTSLFIELIDPSGEGLAGSV